MHKYLNIGICQQIAESVVTFNFTIMPGVHQDMCYLEA